MNGYNYTNGMHGSGWTTDAEFNENAARVAVEAWKVGEISGRSAKEDCELYGYKLDLRNGKLTPID